MGSSSLKHMIYTKLFDGIIRGEYRSVSVLNEKNLVEQFQVSKTPIREALVELCNEGVLRNIPRYGYEIVRMTEQDIKNIQQFRLVLELGCLSNYWDMITPDKIRQLRTAAPVTCYEKGMDDVLNHWAKNKVFHLALISCFDNEYLYFSLNTALNKLTRAYAQFYWDKWHQTSFVSVAGAHQRLVDSIEKGDKEAALRYLRQDISGFEEEP